MELETILICVCTFVVVALFWVVTQYVPQKASWRTAYRPIAPPSLEGRDEAVNGSILMTDWAAVDPLLYQTAIQPFVVVATACLQCVSLIADVFPQAETLMLKDPKCPHNMQPAEQLAVLIHAVCMTHAHPITLSVAFQCAAFLFYVDGFSDNPVAVTEDAVGKIQAKYGQALRDLGNRLHPASRFLLEEGCFQVFSHRQLTELLRGLELEDLDAPAGKNKNA